jgi:hypothetical protein
MAARVRAEVKNGERANRASGGNAPTVNEPLAGPDAGKGRPAAI